jgi:hypothetical protein
MPSAIAFNSGSRTGQLVVSGGLRYADIEYAITSSINRNSYPGINWYSPINPGNGQLVLISNTFTQSIGNGGLSSNPVFYITNTSEEALIGTSTSNPSYTGSLNRLPDTRNQRFTTTASALQFLAESGKYMLVNFTYPNIITDGLTAVYDASFYSSYPTTGSKWYDIDGGTQILPGSGSLFNTPSYDRTGDSGSLSFNGTDQYAQLTGSYINRLNGTIISWFTIGNNNSPQVRGIITNSGSATAGVNTFGWGFSSTVPSEGATITALRATAGTGSSGPNLLIGSGSLGIISGSAGISATTSNNTTFRFAAITWDLTTSTGAYAEPNLNNGGSPWFMPNVKPTDNTQVALNTWIGVGGAATHAGYANTKIGAIYFYNRKMTTAEISASYAITRTKYGGT